MGFGITLPERGLGVTGCHVLCSTPCLEAAFPPARPLNARSPLHGHSPRTSLHLLPVTRCNLGHSPASAPRPGTRGGSADGRTKAQGVHHPRNLIPHSAGQRQPWCGRSADRRPCAPQEHHPAPFCISAQSSQAALGAAEVTFPRSPITNPLCSHCCSNEGTARILLGSFSPQLNYLRVPWLPSRGTLHICSHRAAPLTRVSTRASGTVCTRGCSTNPSTALQTRWHRNCSSSVDAHSSALPGGAQPQITPRPLPEPQQVRCRERKLSPSLCEADALLPCGQWGI